MITISLKTQSELSGKRSGADRKTSERERDCEKREERERSARSENGNGAVSGSPKNWWSVERHLARSRSAHIFPSSNNIGQYWFNIGPIFFSWPNITPILANFSLLLGFSGRSELSILA
jgi:hypothetical protein